MLLLSLTIVWGNLSTSLNTFFNGRTYSSCVCQTMATIIRRSAADHRCIHHIPMLWLGGAIKQPMVIDKLMNQSDMAATLLAQLGISHKEFNFSRNVLGKHDKYPFAYDTYNNGFAFRDSTGTTLIDNNSGKTLIESPAPNERRTELAK